MKISEHFTLSELTKTNAQVVNNPRGSQLENLAQLARGLELVRSAVGAVPIQINSAFRSPEVNALIGGSPSSAHLDGFAADFCVIGMTNRKICTAIIRAGIKFDQLIEEDRNGVQWVHISFAPAMRQQYLVFKNGSYGVASWPPT